MLAALRDLIERWRFERSLKALATSEHDLLRDYASAEWPGRNMTVSQARFVALDFELDGLKRKAHVLQAGWVPFSSTRIPLAGAKVYDIRSGIRLDDQAVTIHGIGEQRAQQGKPVSEVVRELLPALAGRIIVAHGASIERGVLQDLGRKLFGATLPLRAICTLALERRINPGMTGAQPYRLAECRQRHNLPAHGLHDALSDALAAAELFMAQISRLPDETTLGSLESLRIGH